MNKLRMIFCFGILLLNQSLSAQESERWYKVSLGGNPVGYSYENINVSESQTKTLLESNIKIGRLGNSVEMETKISYYEKNDALSLINSEINVSNEKKIEEIEIKPGYVLVQSHEHSREITLDKVLHGPMQITDLIQNKVLKNQETIQYTTYSPEFGMILSGEVKFIAEDNILINGSEINAFLLEERYLELPITRKKWVNEKGQLLKSIEPNPFGEMEIVLTTKENAFYAFSNSVELPENAYGQTMAYSNYRLPMARSVSSIKIKITHKKPELGFPDLTRHNQKVISQSENEVILQLNKPILAKSNLSPVIPIEYLEPNSTLDNSDKFLIEKTKEVIGNETDPWKKTMLITQWVNQNMAFDAGIALADSREVIRDLKGTCVSYAILTATMCKAADIPSRFLMGYVYVDGAWGGHAWAEVSIDGNWVPIDAAVPNDSFIADAARFAMISSSLKSGTGELNISGLQLFGNIDIETLEYSLDKTSKNINIKKPYSIDQDTYNNPGLGFSMEKLTDYEFSDLDRFYPETIILKQTNGNSEVKLEHLSFGLVERTESQIEELLKGVDITEAPEQFFMGNFQGHKVFGADKSLAIIKVDSDVLLLTAGGEAHNHLLDLALEKIKLNNN
ncbi:MAG TPA: transglutaminase domain-containing protein [Anditalea sp.]|nr:transglutaminase domain-containing protein [Anditalea sp.]